MATSKSQRKLIVKFIKKITIINTYFEERQINTLKFLANK